MSCWVTSLWGWGWGLGDFVFRRYQREEQLSELCHGRDMEKKKKGGKGKGRFEDSSDEDMDEDEDEDVDGGLSDEEVDFGDDEDDDLAAEFRREMEGLENEENEEEDNEDEDFSGGKNFDFSCPLCFFVGYNAESDCVPLCQWLVYG